MLSNLLNPLQLQGRLKQELTSVGAERQALRVTQLVPNTVRSFGERLQKAFEGVGRRLGIEATTHHAKGREDLDEVVVRAEDDTERFVLIQVQGREGEVRLLEPVLQRKLKSQLVVYIHRPEELILRIALERVLTYSAAKDVLGQMLGNVAAVILPGACFLDEYQQMLPKVAVVPIPLGFAPPKNITFPASRLVPGSVLALGSITTWGEMRDIRDLLELVDAIRRTGTNEKVLGYAQGDWDAHSDMGQYVRHRQAQFLSNAEILAGQSSGAFCNEEQYRDWLYQRADGRVIIRGRVENGNPVPESIPQQLTELHAWEERLIDFNVQMYREILDARREAGRQGLPKVEYSGTLHKGGTHVIFVVFQSGAMDDVQYNEGLVMVEVPLADGKPDFDAAAARLVELIKGPDERRQMVDHNRVSTESLGMDEVVFAFYLVMDYLRKQHCPV